MSALFRMGAQKRESLRKQKKQERKCSFQFCDDEKNKIIIIRLVKIITRAAKASGNSGKLQTWRIHKCRIRGRIFNTSTYSL
jgi:hypothetical protein